MKLTQADIAHLAECWEALQDDPENYDGPEDVMTSIGYVWLFLDGDVVSYGECIFSLSNDVSYHENS